ncbi:uncharacterized protein SCHCODRAFT_02680727 [Schizophyllum commune H4-8]|uniref:Uncharacterized protein n=1 Tax=Schizophyllum commune (strain H4-8 / FGSC 9210) TaxID=578458 RepID=D8QFJ4_SCHCM|nr:uncharacterized protein SCHCODRAFT_02680727 [Schizophyllum commune H4-8]KAI5887668.1 hypothetical protein SCHCODRAFT_02680727 [Schizophyllum commune H4-8]
MDSLSKLFGGKSDLPLVVVQYKRDEFGVGTEDELHWAIVAVSSNKSGTIVGAVWQVINRVYSDGRGIVWSMHHRSEVELNASSKCLGGVIIGSIKGKDVEKLNTLIESNHVPQVRTKDWNCRSWVMEVIQYTLMPKGWANVPIATEASLLPSLKVAARASRDASIKEGKTMPLLVDFRA